MDLHPERPHDGGHGIGGGDDTDADAVRPCHPADRRHDSAAQREVLHGCEVVVDQHPVSDPERVPLERPHAVARRGSVAVRARGEAETVIC